MSIVRGSALILLTLSVGLSIFFVAGWLSYGLLPWDLVHEVFREPNYYRCEGVWPFRECQPTF